VGGGKSSSSSLARFWLLSQVLGPVKASSYRLASRIANGLRAGYPVRDFAEFDACGLIFISLPDRSVPQAIAELAAAGISWRGKSVVLFSAKHGSCELLTLSARGASVASISSVPGFRDTLYMLEGDRRAVQETRRLIEKGEVRCVTIDRGFKSLYLAALTCTG